MLDEIRSWFLKINNTDNPLVKLIQNRREKNTITNVKNETGDITIDV